MPRSAIWMKPPAHLRAGAVWVLVDNWQRACARRYGSCGVYTPDGELSAAALTAAMAEHGTSRRGQASTARKLASTAVKDLRSWRRARRARAAVPEVDGLDTFVLSHHGIFEDAAQVMARRHGVASVVHVDAPTVWEARQWGTRRPGWGRLVERFGEARILSRADVVLCVTEEVRDLVVQLGVDPDRTLLNPCTADPEDYRVAASRREEVADADAVVVGWMGSFRPFHNVHLLVDALAVARRTDPRIELLLVGDGPMLADTIARAEQEGVPVRSIGAVPHDQMAAYVVAMDIGVIPASADQQFHYSPLKLKEFMAAGLPVVAPAVGEMARTLADGDDAMLYAPGDVSGMAGCILALAEDEERRTRIGRQATATLQRRFSLDAMFDALDARLGLG
jgi:glycosyltransferase involved in cell wall biosynthesis